MYNKHDVYTGDVFYLYFFGVNLFFQIKSGEWDSVYIKELKTKKIDDKKHEMVIYNQGKKDGSCLIVPHTIHNDGKLFKVKTNKINDVSVLEINVEKDSELYKAALRINSSELANRINNELGIRYAVKISDESNWYNWYYDYRCSDIPSKEVEENNKIERMYG